MFWRYCAGVLFVCAIFYIIYKIHDWIANSVKGKTIPVSVNDCFGDYHKAITIINKRWKASNDLSHEDKMLGFTWRDDINQYYPAIAFFRMCHLVGYEVEIRPMREENSPLEEGEIVCRMKDEYWEKFSVTGKEEHRC